MRISDWSSDVCSSDLLRPAGPLREPAQRGESVDFRVLNVGSGAAEAGFGEWPMRLVADHAQPLVGGRPVPLPALAGKRVHAVAGIRSEEHTSELQSLMRLSHPALCLKNTTYTPPTTA